MSDDEQEERGVARPYTHKCPCDISEDFERFSFVNASTTPYTERRLGLVDELTDDEKRMLLLRKDRLLDRWSGKDVRLAAGGMTVWYMIECLALTEECKSIAAEMRSTRDLNEEMTKKDVINAEFMTTLQNYSLTIHEWFAVHTRFHNIIIRSLRVDSDNLEILDPLTIRNQWNIMKTRLS